MTLRKDREGSTRQRRGESVWAVGVAMEPACGSGVVLIEVEGWPWVAVSWRVSCMERFNRGEDPGRAPLSDSPVPPSSEAWRALCSQQSSFSRLTVRPPPSNPYRLPNPT